MEPLELLSEILIGTLKEFSSSKQALTPSSLSRALADNRELSELLSEAVLTSPPDRSESPLPSSGTSLAVAALPDSGSDVARASRSHFLHVRGTYVDILSGLGPIVREGYVERLSELQRRLED